MSAEKRKELRKIAKKKGFLEQFSCAVGLEYPGDVLVAIASAEDEHAVSRILYDARCKYL